MGVLIFVAGLVLGLAWRPIRRALHPGETVADEPISIAPPGAALSERAALEFQLEGELQEAASQLDHPLQLRESPIFAHACAALASDLFDEQELRGWVINDRRLLHVVAGHVLLSNEERADEVEELILAGLGNYSPFSRFLMLAVLGDRHPPPTPWVHELLAQLDGTWLSEHELRALREWVAVRRQQGDEPPVGDAWIRWCKDQSPNQMQLIFDLLNALGPAVAKPWLGGLAEWNKYRESEASESADPAAGGPAFDLSGGDPLRTCGRLWDESSVAQLDEEVSFPALAESVDRIVNLLKADTPRPIVVIGAPRTGKTTLIRAVMRRLLGVGWRALEASPDAVNAGMSMVGQLEARVSRLAEAVRPDRRVLWVVPDATALLWSGSVMGDQGRTLARMLRQDLESRRLLFLGECTQAEWQHARVEAPWLDDALEVVAVPVPDEATTLDLVKSYVERGGDETLDPVLLREAWELTRQFLDENQRPGNLFDTMRRALEDGDRPRRGVSLLTHADLLESVSRQTGLSLDLLDDSRSLDLAAVETFFEQRIRGQDEAVRCVLDRLAMIKAGVTDPSQPLGVFLFAGPTGTGKTEMAKTVSTWLFGSASRLLRLDMSEFKDAGSLDKLLGSSGGYAPGSGHALVDRIRREPYSVLLLDEFEKAHPEVWDLFLQVFDDGRLSDRRGRTADFRHCMILLTTNLGAQVESKPGVGFWAQAAGFQIDKLHEALRTTFRPEFLNRLDRVVVFRPLSREVMSAILQLQIDAALRRRGLRDRPWAVEWDDSALELLLDRGFSVELGARPLKRALEHYLLAPLARTMVGQGAPAGEQFLFVRAAGDELVIEFVDPDLDVSALGGELETAHVSPRGIATIAGDARGERSELAQLSAELGELEGVVNGDPWQQARQAELEMTSLSDFWKSPERFEVLDVFATRERVERALLSARSLHDRLARPSYSRVPASPLQQLALRLHLLRLAVIDLEQKKPREVVLMVQARSRGDGDGNATQFSRQVIEMYRGWAQRRGAKLTELGEISTGKARAWAASVQSFGVWSLLRPEGGLHVLEEPGRDGRPPARRTVRVHVVAVEPSSADSNAAVELAREALGSSGELARQPIVRRYRELPSPLVRDAVRGWRTGRLDRVLSGDFDIIGDEIKNEAS